MYVFFKEDDGQQPRISDNPKILQVVILFLALMKYIVAILVYFPYKEDNGQQPSIHITDNTKLQVVILLLALMKYSIIFVYKD